MTILGNPPSNTLLRVLNYGDSQRKKTWWAGRAAEAGFNCLVLNGDKPATIYRQLPESAQARIRIVNCLSDNYNYSNLIAGLLKYRKFMWDINDSKKAIVGMENKAHAHFKINLDKLTNNDVLILDSWTGLVNGTVRRLATDLNVDLSEVAKIEWNLYGPSGLFLNWVLGELQQLPCHVIVIAHADTWEKQKKDSKGKLTAEIEFSRVQPVSSSRPHGKLMAKYFTDTFFFHMVGDQFFVDSSANAERDSGSTTVAPKRYKWDDLQFVDLCKTAGIPLPLADGKEFEAVEYIPSASQEIVTEAAKSPTVSVTMPTLDANGDKPKSLAALMGKSQK